MRNYEREFKIECILINSGFFCYKEGSRAPLLLKDTRYGYNVFSNKWFKMGNTYLISTKEITAIEDEMDNFPQEFQSWFLFNLDLFA